MRGGYSSGCFTSGSSYSASTVGDCAAGAVAGASPGSGNPASTTNAEDVEMTYLCSLLKDVIKKGKFTKVAEIVSLQKPSSSCWTTDYTSCVFNGSGYKETRREPMGWQKFIANRMQMLDDEKAAFLGGSPAFVRAAFCSCRTWRTHSTREQSSETCRRTQGFENVRPPTGSRWTSCLGNTTWSGVSQDPIGPWISPDQGMMAKDHQRVGLLKTQARWLTN